MTDCDMHLLDMVGFIRRNADREIARRAQFTACPAGDCRRPRALAARQARLISQKTKLATAIRYALSHWEGLTRIEIDPNVVERTIRPIALNRNYVELFAGSDGGGEHWAVIASLIETCKLIGVDPHAYLTDVITKLVNGHLNSKIDDLLPWAYPAVHALRDVA